MYPAGSLKFTIRETLCLTTPSNEKLHIRMFYIKVSIPIAKTPTFLSANSRNKIVTLNSLLTQTSTVSIKGEYVNIELSKSYHK